MFTYQKGNVPIKVWLDEQSYYSDAGLCQDTEMLSRHPYIFHHVSLMPDAHKGYAIPIGGVAAFKGAICPYGVGMDIGCGMIACKLDVDAVAINDRTLRTSIKDRIKDVIPMGFNHHKNKAHITGATATCKTVLDDADAVADIATKESILHQLGTLGGGNHFIEVQTDERGKLWLMLHSGSRNLGAQACKKYHKLAVECCETHKIALPNPELAVLPFEYSGEQYVATMNYCLQFAMDSRVNMMDTLIGIIREFLPGINEVGRIHVHHNYASCEKHFGETVWVHRKGATNASQSSFGVIPGSMGTASYIVSGKGNEQSFSSCSHGSGRTMSRSKAKKAITMDDFKTAMGDVVYDHSNSLLDESPAAYKDISMVMLNQLDLVDVVHTLSPLIAVKSVNCKED